MPRKAKAQPRLAPQDQAYGQRGEQLAAQAQMPLPDNRTVIPNVSPSPATSSAPTTGAPPADPVAGLLEAARLTPMPTPLSAPTERPNEPVTSGIPRGPGPGPEALAPVDKPNHVAEILRLVAQASGDPKIAAMAQRIAAR